MRHQQDSKDIGSYTQHALFVRGELRIVTVFIEFVGGLLEVLLDCFAQLPSGRYCRCYVVTVRVPDLGVRFGDLTYGTLSDMTTTSQVVCGCFLQRLGMRATGPLLASRGFSKPGTRGTRYRVFSFEVRLIRQRSCQMM